MGMTDNCISGALITNLTLPGEETMPEEPKLVPNPTFWDVLMAMPQGVAIELAVVLPARSWLERPFTRASFEMLPYDPVGAIRAYERISGRTF